LGPSAANIERMRDLLNRTAEIAARYLETLDERGVAPAPEALALLAELDQPLQEDPQDPTAVLEMLDRIGSPATMGMAGRRYFGFVIGGSLPAALAANWLAGTWDQCRACLPRRPSGRC
jgi:hypothetical protein